MAKGKKPACDGRILILGGGPTGLGAAWRLTELGYTNFRLYEATRVWGGLSASFVDPKGFTWDIGGHIQFSHYAYFDKLMKTILQNNSLSHVRESWVWIEKRFVPYPFQLNIHHLRPSSLRKCLAGLEAVAALKKKTTSLNFEQWILRSFGKGIAELFMLPYNRKVWAHPLKDIATEWLGERVPTVDLKAIRASTQSRDHDQHLRSWGPNRIFRFPKHGGTGAIWKCLAEMIPPKNRSLGKRATAIDSDTRIVTFSDGSQDHYDALLSTIPLPDLIQLANLSSLKTVSKKLISNHIHVVGLGLRKPITDGLATKHWIYFPQRSVPFYRLTVFSNYSPYTVPDPDTFWSLMAEIAGSSAPPLDASEITQKTVHTLLQTGFIQSRDQIASTWYHFAPRAYPIPSLHRNRALTTILPVLEKKKIFSRGRFGGWKYEVGNQDHTCMQGVEVVNRLLLGSREITYFHPCSVNRQAKG